MPNGNGFQISDDRSHRVMGLNSEPHKNSVFYMDIGLASYASEVLLPDGCIIETKLDCKQRFTVTYTDKLKNSRSLLGKASA